MKFDFAIGNPPYQEHSQNTSDTPIYNDFMEAAYEVADKVELISPARFLFNAGKTPKAWNEKMLNDIHFKVLHYEPDSQKVFPNTDIKGGVAITYRDSSKEYTPIDIFTQYTELNDILKKVKEKMTNSISDIVFSPESYKFTETMHMDYPNVKGLLSKGHSYDITSNIFDKLERIVFFKEKPNDSNQYIQMIGRKDNARIGMWINRKYIAEHGNLQKFKLLFPKTNGSGNFGEPMSSAVVASPNMGHTQTFISIGAFNTEEEAVFLNKYLRGKFARAMLGVLKVTQDNKKGVWKYVPLENFTSDSDINWNTSISNIDKQLYKKYNLTQEQIDFIETHVKEME